MLRERLAELEFMLTEGRVERGLLRDRGDPTKWTDEEFEQFFADRRRQQEEQLSTAIELAARLPDRCRNEAIDVERRSAVGDSDPVTSSPMPVPPEIPSSSFKASAQTKQILNWLDGVYQIRKDGLKDKEHPPEYIVRGSPTVCGGRFIFSPAS